MLSQFDQMVTTPALVDFCRQLFEDGHYTRSVEEAFKILNNEVKALANIKEADGVKLMHIAFSPKNPTLRGCFRSVDFVLLYR